MSRLIELYAENFMGVKAVRIRPKSAVTKIIGKNAAGKSSVLDALVAAIGGASYVPERPIRNGATSAKIVLDLGDLLVKKRFTASGAVLEVTSRDGAKYPSPQAKLDALFGPISIDPLAFKNLKPMEKAAMVAKIAGIDIEKFAKEKKALFEERTNTNRDLKTAEAQLAGMPEVAGPDAEVSIAEVLKSISDAESHNKIGEQFSRDADKIAVDIRDARKDVEIESKRPEMLAATLHDRLQSIDREIARLNAQKDEFKKEHDAEVAKLTNYIASQSAKIVDMEKQLADANAKVSEFTSVDVQPLRDKAANVESENAKARQRAARQAKWKEVEGLKCKVHDLTIDIDAIDESRNESIRSASLPVPGLTLTDTGVSINAVPFEQCSESEQIRASVAIGLGTKATVKIMRVKDGSLLDNEGRRILEEMAEAADAQVLVELVDTGSEQGVRIVDGEVSEVEPDGYSEPVDDVAPVATNAF